MLAVTGVFIVGGVHFLVASHAATPVVAIEPEMGTLSNGAIKLSDNSASGNSAIQFVYSGQTPPPTPVPTPRPSPGTGPTGTGWRSKPLYVDPYNSASTYASSNPSATGASLITWMGKQPVARWFGGWNGNVQSDASSYVTAAESAGAVPVLVSYNIPNRDCGGYSAGGAQTEADYATWIHQLATGIGTHMAVVILEPDAVALNSCLNADQQAARNRELSGAVSALKSHSNTAVYIDAGHANWLSASDTASRLRQSNVATADGFSLNVSNYTTTADNTTLGNQVAALIQNKHYVIDTSRNGNGPTPDAQWCNPPGRALGHLPTTNTGQALTDGYLWIKTPWESDGNCNGGPAAGQPNWPYAIGLAQAAGW